MEETTDQVNEEEQDAEQGEQALGLGPDEEPADEQRDGQHDPEEGDAELASDDEAVESVFVHAALGEGLRARPPRCRRGPRRIPERPHRGGAARHR